MGAAGRGSLVAVGAAVGDADGAVGTGPPEPHAASPRASPARVRAGATRLMKASKRLQAEDTAFPAVASRPAPPDNGPP